MDDPAGADCMPGGVSPCGLEAGAPPDFVSSGPSGARAPEFDPAPEPMVVGVELEPDGDEALLLAVVVRSLTL